MSVYVSNYLALHAERVVLNREMSSSLQVVHFVFVTLCFLSGCKAGNRFWMTTDELENHISPQDIEEFLRFYDQNGSSTTVDGRWRPEVSDDYASVEETATNLPVPAEVDCFGLGGVTNQLRWILNLKPDSSEKVNVHYYFSSRKQPSRVQVMAGEQFGLEWADFSPTSRRTVLIVHGFMSHSNASWVHDMTRAFLLWEDVNVIAVDWSGGGNTWKYWRAVANTRRVGADVTAFLQSLVIETGLRKQDIHLVGHSLGAHICSYVSLHLGGVARITGLDPAQPCFRTSDRSVKLDDTDAEFVDVIHTNGRLMQRVGFGLPDPAGHADFYPNGGMKQPGCRNETNNSIWSRILPPTLSPAKLKQAICSHGRAYLLFTESLINTNCTFRAHSWNLTYQGVNASLEAACDRLASCSEMGIRAIGGGGRLRAKGTYFVLTTESEPYCPTELERKHPSPDLLWDLRRGFRIDRSWKPRPTAATLAYANPDSDVTDDYTTTPRDRDWRFWRWIG